MPMDVHRVDLTWAHRPPVFALVRRRPPAWVQQRVHRDRSGGVRVSCLLPGTMQGSGTPWYAEAIPLAEQRYKTYLVERGEEESYQR